MPEPPNLYGGDAVFVLILNGERKE